ncbi:MULTISPECIES: alpha/beta fold hydrolase [Thermomonospora]|uniref:TAP domain protein n=1 Tax=Thermomonospora curvata (strain ATCC 19995 / DSM 43183 / JCM 3096 / KCTC 9072 / NBRC 15933 / NCIMB 10081 / Henssen B9) TaxID=471852 RepID=D1A6S6_THECD|nr:MULTISPECIES: alpha/beta fold hydrolase [Thermomonospora]ACY98330.1 TAP domain protein [Thermomonospora curvata DSM 43183]PKK13495.1 MAG: alpha/beta hydrolase [Thermomonospora sp. CIF 1]
MTVAEAKDALQAFRDQQVRWTDAGQGLEQATIEVPLDYSNPTGRWLTIAISRRRALDPQRRRGILLAVNGGPGGYFGFGRRFPDILADSPLAHCYDLIGFDPRGTGDSTPLTSEVTPVRAPLDSRPDDAAFALIAEDMRVREEGNQRAGGDLRPHFSTRNIARDMDLIRAVLGEPVINFLGYTFGTYLGAVYGSMFPAHLDRSVLDSCVHPDWSWREQLMAQGPANRENVEKWAAWVAERNRHFGLGTSAEQVLEAVEEAAAALAADGRAESIRLRTLFDGALGSRSANRARWEELGRMVADLRGGDLEAARTWLADERIWPPTETGGTTRCGVLDAVTLEKDWPTDLETYYADMRRYRERYPYGYGVMRAQPWVGAFRSFRPPEPPTVLRRDGYPAGIVVRADGDPIDHAAGGAAMAARLGHRLITVADSGQHEIYLLCRNPEVDALVTGYLVDGVLPPHDVVCASTVPRPDIPADPAE